MKNSALFVLSLAVFATACGPHKRELAKQGLNLKPLAKPDECPAADGKCTLDGGTVIEMGRQEGFLTISNPELDGKLVSDGQSRPVKQKSTGGRAEVTTTCSKQLIKISYKFEGKTVTQTWNVDLEKDILGIVEKDADNQKLIQGLRKYETPTDKTGA